MPQTTRRGFVPEDVSAFGPLALPVLHRAQADICYLLDHGYNMDGAAAYVGNHFQLSARQRLALKRALAPRADVQSRRARLLEAPAPGSTVYIDGLNIIITLEVALSGSTLLRCMDGAVRDLAGLRGTYRIIDKTHHALALLFAHLQKWEAERCVFYLDAPVSNTGRLKTLLLETAETYGLPVQVRLVSNADVPLRDCAQVVTTDGIILNQCGSWLNLAASILETLPQLSYVDFLHPVQTI